MNRLWISACLVCLAGRVWAAPLPRAPEPVTVVLPDYGAEVRAFDAPDRQPVGWWPHVVNAAWGGGSGGPERRGGWIDKHWPLVDYLDRSGDYTTHEYLANRGIWYEVYGNNEYQETIHFHEEGARKLFWDNGIARSARSCGWRATLLGVALAAFGSSVSAYELSDHPRIFINRAGIGSLAEKARGPLATEYAPIKAEADRACKSGVRSSNSRFRTPVEQICLGIAYLVERELGRDSAAYAETIKAFWKDGQLLSPDGSGHFGYHALVYDWIYDAMTPQERTKFGNALGPWLRWYTDTPQITLKYGHWRYNQTWGPAHLNTPNTRDGITPKLLVALAIRGAGTDYEDDAGRFLDSWAKRIPQECVPAFDEMGGVWSESMGHGNYGPVAVIPWAFEAWRTATGQDFFQLGAPTTFLKGMTRWAREFFVIYDRIHATRASFPKTWFLHIPGEPQVSGRETVLVPGHVYAYQGDTANWLSDPAGRGPVLSTGRSRAFLKTLLPAGATIVKRGGDGHQLWGHPHEPSAQYNHAGGRSLRPPVVPWRLEVEGPGGEAKGDFLHVLEVGEKEDSAMSRVELVRTEGQVGVSLDAAGARVVVRFANEGPLAASIQVGDGPEEILGSDN